jgi:hypothetical protein
MHPAYPSRVAKNADHLPLARLEGIVARSGVTLARSTLCDWMARAAGLLTPLVSLMQGRLLQSRVIHSDDTPVPFREQGKDKTSTGHLWVYIGDRDHPYVRFDFTTHYRRDGPEQVLKGYAGYLQADTLAQYERLFATGAVKRFCDLLNKTQPLLSETERERVFGALETDGDSRGPFDHWLEDLKQGRSRLPDMQASAMKALLFAWLHQAVGQPMVCNQCGLEYPRLAGPRGIAVRHLLPPQSTAPYQVARLFDACPSCRASRYYTTWPDRVPHHDLAWKTLVDVASNRVTSAGDVFFIGV